MRDRNHSEHTVTRHATTLLCAAALLGGASAALAQNEQAEYLFIPTQAGQSQDAANRELEDARREFEAAQRNFEEAARAAAERERERQSALETRERERQAVREQQERQTAVEERERQAAANREESAGQLERARRELNEAQRNLEQAAREVARLSARAVGPIVQDFQRQWLGTGQRAVLGLVVEDAADGARITAVSPGGPAANAGVRNGDVIVAIDGRTLVAQGRGPSRVLIERLSDVEPGDVVVLGISRDGARQDLRVETREREGRIFTFEAPQFERFTNLFRPQGRWSSMELVSLTPELGAYFGTDRGLLVVRAPEDESLRLQDGDVILDIGGREPNSPEHAMRILGSFEPGETIVLTIMRQQQRQTLEIPLTEEESGDANGSGESA